MGCKPAARKANKRRFGIGYAAHKNMLTRLLVHADDDQNWAFLLERALDKGGLTGWKYQHFDSGNLLVQYLETVKSGNTEKPNLLVLDIRMPEMTGLEVLEWASTNLPELPAVMLSSSELLEDRLAARNLGSKGYFSKAAIFTEFLDFLRAWDETALAIAPRQHPASTNIRNCRDR
jgi:CheY-like chemotaxis protein